MKRFVIFATLGPLIGFIVFVALVHAFNYAVDGSLTLGIGHVVLIPTAYTLGIIPALITAWFDYAIRNTRLRIMWTALFACFAGGMPLAVFFMGFLNTPYAAIVGLVGLVPGAVCSWLSGEK